MNKKALALLSTGHLVADTYPGMLPVLLPFFKEALGLSYTMAGFIILLSNLTSSAFHPIFGYLSDRRPKGWLLPWAPFIAAAGMALSGAMTDYWLLVLCVVISGIGLAIYHTEGLKTLNSFVGERKATGISVYMVGGNLGVALAPMLALVLVTSFGLKGTLGLGIPGIVMTGILLVLFPRLTRPSPANSAPVKKGKGSLSKRELTPFFLLVGIVTLRAWIQYGLLTYIPFYYIDYLKGNPLYAGKLISVFLMVGVVGTGIAGPIADRWGHRNFLIVNTILIFPVLLLSYHTEGLALFVILGMAGMLLVSLPVVTLAMGQTLLPNNLGMVAGFLVGVAVGMGGLGVTVLGMIADRWGVPMALQSISILPVFALVLCLLVEYPPRREVPSESASTGDR